MIRVILLIAVAMMLLYGLNGPEDESGYRLTAQQQREIISRWNDTHHMMEVNAAIDAPKMTIYPVRGK